MTAQKPGYHLLLFLFSYASDTGEATELDDSFRHAAQPDARDRQRSEPGLIKRAPVQPHSERKKGGD